MNFIHMYIRFTPILSTAVDKTLSLYTIKEACEKTGIFLLNLEANKLAPKEPTNLFSSAKKDNKQRRTRGEEQKKRGRRKRESIKATRG